MFPVQNLGPGDRFANFIQVWTAGQVIGLIHDIPTCKDLVERIEREAVETLQEAQSLYVPETGKSKL